MFQLVVKFVSLAIAQDGASGGVIQTVIVRPYRGVGYLPTKEDYLVRRVIEGHVLGHSLWDELSRFVADNRSLQVLKVEGCSNLGVLIVSSSSLTTLWLSDLHSLLKTVFNCPNMREISLDFTRRENDSTDLTTMFDNLGKSCHRLQNIHIASIRFSNAAVLALSAAHLRALRILSLVLGSGITNASVAAITSSFTDLELLDLSGSSKSYSGIGMICKW